MDGGMGRWDVVEMGQRRGGSVIYVAKMILREFGS
jgi:cephalosporin hydroxylase